MGNLAGACLVFQEPWNNSLAPVRFRQANVGLAGKLQDRHLKGVNDDGCIIGQMQCSAVLQAAANLLLPPALQQGLCRQKLVGCCQGSVILSLLLAACLADAVHALETDSQLADTRRRQNGHTNIATCLPSALAHSAKSAFSLAPQYWRMLIAQATPL